jgi:hypothetical protein
LVGSENSGNFASGNNDTADTNGGGENITPPSDGVIGGNGGQPTRLNFNITQNAGEDNADNRLTAKNEEDRVAYKEALETLRSEDATEEERKAAEETIARIEQQRKEQMIKLAQEALKGIDGVRIVSVEEGTGVYLNDENKEVIEYTSVVEVEVEEGKEAAAIAAMAAVAEVSKQDSFIVNYPTVDGAARGVPQSYSEKWQKPTSTAQVVVPLNKPLTKTQVAILTKAFIDKGLGVTITDKEISASNFKFEDDNEFYEVTDGILNTFKNGNAKTDIQERGGSKSLQGEQVVQGEAGGRVESALDLSKVIYRNNYSHYNEATKNGNERDYTTVERVDNEWNHTGDQSIYEQEDSSSALRVPQTNISRTDLLQRLQEVYNSTEEAMSSPAIDTSNTEAPNAPEPDAPKPTRKPRETKPKLTDEEKEEQAQQAKRDFIDDIITELTKQEVDADGNVTDPGDITADQVEMVREFLDNIIENMRRLAMARRVEGIDPKKDSDWKEYDEELGQWVRVFKSKSTGYASINTYLDILSDYLEWRYKMATTHHTGLDVNYDAAEEYAKLMAFVELRAEFADEVKRRKEKGIEISETKNKKHCTPFELAALADKKKEKTFTQKRNKDKDEDKDKEGDGEYHNETAEKKQEKQTERDRIADEFLKKHGSIADYLKNTYIPDFKIDGKPVSLYDYLSKDKKGRKDMQGAYAAQHTSDTAGGSVKTENLTPIIHDMLVRDNVDKVIYSKHYQIEDSDGKKKTVTIKETTPATTLEKILQAEQITNGMSQLGLDIDNDTNNDVDVEEDTETNEEKDTDEEESQDDIDENTEKAATEEAEKAAKKGKKKGSSIDKEIASLKADNERQAFLEVKVDIEDASQEEEAELAKLKANEAQRNARLAELNAEQIAKTDAAIESGSTGYEDTLDSDDVYFRTRRVHLSKEENKRREPMRKRAKELEQKLGVPVRIIEDLSQLPDPRTRQAIRRAERRGNTTLGWFDASTGEVFLYMPGLVDVADVEQTYIHEAVAHRGLRALLGKAAFNNLCDEVWSWMNANMSVSERQEWEDYPGVRNADGSINTRVAADEYMAHVAEQMRLGKLERKAKAKLSDTEHKVWNKIVEYVKRALHNIKVFFKPEHTGTQRTQREIDDYIRDLIVDSYANMRSGNTSAVQGDGVRMSAKAQEEVDGISSLAGVNNNSSWNDALSAIAATSHAISDTGTPGQSTNSKDAAKVQISEIDNSLTETARQEMQAIRDEAIANGTYMKAPNGKSTNLNERQWLQVRTKAFKKWFGDWELAAKWLKIKSLKAMQIENRTVSEDEAREAYERIGSVENAIDGKKVDFVKTSFGKILRHKGVDTKIIMDKLDVLFKESVPLFFEEETVKEGHKDHSSNFVGYHHYLNKITIDGKDYYVRFTAQEIRTNPTKKKADGFTPYQFHNTSISDVDIYESTESSVESPGTFPVTGTNRAYVDAKLGNYLESAKEAYENSSKIVDENDEPIVVYHGGDSDIRVFDRSKTNTASGGFFFTLDKNVAKDYGNVTEVFLNIKNLLENDSEGFEGIGPVSSNNPYDGEQYFHKDAEAFIVWNPNQIKSATDNNGDFSESDNDIRFSVRPRMSAKGKSNAATQFVLDMLHKAGLKTHLATKADVDAVMQALYGGDLSKGLQMATEALNKETSASPTAIENNSTRHLHEEEPVSTAKVDNRIDIPKDFKEKLSSLSEKIKNGGKLTPEQFLLSIENALGASNSNTDKTTYYKGNEDKTLRLANHRSNASMFLVHDHETGNTSVVVKMSERKFRKDSGVDLKESVYFPDKLTPEVQQSIIKGLIDWVETGEYKQPCDQINVSIRKDGIQAMMVYHGTGADFDHFDHSHMGEGEGAQAYGWGTYVTQVEGIGREYAIATADRSTVDNMGRFRFMWYDAMDFFSNEANEKWYDLVEKVTDIDVELSALRSIVSNFYDNPEPAAGWTRIFPTAKDIEKSKKQIIELEKEKANLEKKIKIFQLIDNFFSSLKEKIKHTKRFLYTVEIPDDNGSNYFDWTADASTLIERAGISAEECKQNSLHTGADVYRYLEEREGSDKRASMYLAERGYDGVKYPADFRRGGRADGAQNFVIFNEADAKIVDKVRFFRTANGTLMGWAVNGEIYLTPEGLNPNTPIHEYTHLWDNACQQVNPELWKRGVELMKQTPLWDEVKNDPNYANLTTDDEIAGEVHARLSGEDGAALLERMEREAADMDAASMVERLSLVDKLKKWLSDFWHWTKDTFAPWTKEEAAQVSIDDFVRMPLADLLNGVNPNAFGVDEKGVRFEQAEEKKDVPLYGNSRPRYASGSVVGMQDLPKSLQMRTDKLWSEAHQNHGDKISALLEEVPENGKIPYASEHNGVWYFYSVDKDHTISIIDAIRGGNNTRAGKARESKINKLLEEYGLDRNTGGVRSTLQANEDGGNGRVLGDGSTSSDGRGIGGTNTVQNREGQNQQSSDASRVDGQNSGSDGASNQSEASERGAARVESVDGLRMRVRSAKKNSKSLKSYLAKAGKAIEDYKWYVYEQVVNMNHTLGEFYKQANKLRKAEGKEQFGVNLDLAHLASNMRGRAAGLANEFSRKYCKPLAEEFDALIKQVVEERGVSEVEAKRMILRQKKNAGSNYDTAVVITKNNESNTIGVASEAGHPHRSVQPMPNSTAKVNKRNDIAKYESKRHRFNTKSSKRQKHSRAYC